MHPRKRILVTRFSALGDVALTIPVLSCMVEQFPNVELVLVSQGFAEPLVRNISGITLFKADLKGKHRGFWGLWKLSKELKKMGKWYGFADLHDVLRTKLLRIFLIFAIPKQAVINKGRKEKRALTRRKNKKIHQLTHSVNRYNGVFNALGFKVNVEFNSLTDRFDSQSASIAKLLGEKNDTWIGFAPFAKHKGKAYPLELSKQVIENLSNEPNIRIMLFGGGKEEVNTLNELERLFPNTISLAGKLSLDDELIVMSKLDVMLSMDSANMHLASLVGTRVVSIWGATHPNAGFYGWNQLSDDAIQINDLGCRPCSVFGNKPCFRKDYACLYQIEPKEIVSKIKKIIDI